MRVHERDGQTQRRWPGRACRWLKGTHLATWLPLQHPKQASKLLILPLQGPQPPSFCLPHFIMQRRSGSRQGFWGVEDTVRTPLLP